MYPSYDSSSSPSERSLQSPAERFASYRHPKGTLLLLGRTGWRTSRPIFFGLHQEDRLRHVWVVGKTGVGKSTFLAGLLAQDLARGRGAALLDPHGSLVEAVLAQVPRSRTNDVILVRPADTAHPVAFNIFRQGRKRHQDPARLASALISAFKAQWSRFWGPRLEHVLRHAVLAVAEHPEATMTLLYEFLVDERLREKLIARLRDEQVRTFWTKEWPTYPKALQAEALSPVLNKLGAFTGNPTVRAIVGQVRSRLDLSRVIEEQQLLLVDLSIGIIGEDAAHLLGGLMLSSLTLAAMTRSCPSPAFSVYLDEFQRVVNASLPTVLAESRKFGLGFVLAHQYLDQLPKELTASLLGNIGTTICFRVGPRDADTLAPVFAPELLKPHLTELPAYHMAVKQLAHGESLPAFLAKSLPTLPVPVDAVQRIARITRASRVRYARTTHDTTTPSKQTLPETSQRFTWS